MALLQIAEPGMSPAPHQRRMAIGIDLGTTHSLVATVRHGLPDVIQDQHGRALMPSVVRYLSNGDVQIGHDAHPFLRSDSLNTISSFKRLMGRGYQDVVGQGLPYSLVDTGGMVAVKTVAGEHSPVELSAQVLAKLRQLSEDALQEDVVGAVITVPAYFDDAQRQATLDAAKLAGISVLRLLNEPTAAALAYGLDRASEGVFAIYDLGGGTFDISVLRLSQGVFEVLSTGGDTALGGDDFDRVLVQWIKDNWNLHQGLAPEDERSLILAAKGVREHLSQADEATVQLTLSTSHSIAVHLTRTRLFELCEHLLERTLTCVRRALKDANLSESEIQGVVLVGGATRMPMIRAGVEAFFKQTPLTDLDPDQVVVIGAALQANLLVGNQSAGQDWLLLDVLPLSLGLETMGGLVERIIPRNSTIPVARAQDFTTFKDGQTAMSIHVLQGERELVDDNRSLAKFELRGIPPMVAGAARIRVTFQVDADGVLAVSAREQSTGVETAVRVTPSYGLSEDEVTRMLTEGMTLASEDKHARVLREEQVEARRLIESVQSALLTDRDLLSDDEFAVIQDSLDKLIAVSTGSDVLLIRQSVATLNSNTDVFAERRMNRSIMAALSGKSVDQI